MSLVPASSVYSVEEEDEGVVVFAVQKALNASALKPENRITVDSVFGAETTEAVLRFQTKKGLFEDGIFGPACSEAMALALFPKVKTVVPDGLLRGLVEGESGNLIGAVNWSVAGGVDCSYCQRRVLDADLGDPEVVRRAFDPLYQMQLFATRLRERFDAYLPMVSNRERAWRIATLVHNYPYAAQQYALGRWPSAYALAPQSWVIDIGARFPDGAQVQTPDDWCRHYSLGAPAHDDPGTMTKYVTAW